MHQFLYRPEITPALDVLLQNMDNTTGGKHGRVTINPFNINQFKSIPLDFTARPKNKNRIRKEVSAMLTRV